MKRPYSLIIAVVCLLVFFMLGSFGSRASNNKPGNRAAGAPSPVPLSSIDPDKKVDASTGAASPATQSDNGEDEDSDPDLGKSHGTMDHQKYVRMRDEFVARKRGIESGRLRCALELLLGIQRTPRCHRSCLSKCLRSPYLGPGTLVIHKKLPIDLAADRGLGNDLKRPSWSLWRWIVPNIRRQLILE